MQSKVEELFREMSKLGDMGCAIGLCFTGGIPEYTRFSYAQSFLSEYQKLSMQENDPTLAYGFHKDGIETWRQLCPNPENNPSMFLAKKHGMIDGICFSTTVNGMKSIASLACSKRADPMAGGVERIYELIELASLEVARGIASTLNPKSIEWLKLSAEGLSDPEIAERLNLSVPGARKRGRVARDELGAKTSAHAVAIAAKRGLLTSYL